MNDCHYYQLETVNFEAFNNQGAKYEIESIKSSVTIAFSVLVKLCEIENTEMRLFKM